MASSTRLYEVAVELPYDPPVRRTFLVESKSREGAEKHVARKYVGEAKIATPKRIAELMAPPLSVTAETAGE